MPRVVFVDTSVLCNLLAVPGRDQHRSRVIAEFQQRADAGTQFVLPLTALIETGNHIANSTASRRTAAERFVRMVWQIVEGTAPWRLNRVEWGQSLLRAFVDGDSAGQPAIDLLGAAQLGAGDLAILVERDDFIARTAYKASEVGVWSLDDGLSAYG